MATVRSAEQSLRELETAVESLTGEPVEVLRDRSLEKGRRLAELRHGAPMQVSGDPDGVLWTHEKVEAELDRALEKQELSDRNGEKTMVAKRRYAANTTVAVENSQVELVRLFKRHGATQHAFVNDSASGRAAVIFAMGGRQMRLELTVPGESDFLAKEHPKPRGWYGFSQTRRQNWARAQQQQAERQRWRALILVTKGKLELVAEGLSTIEREFLADILLPDGRRVGDALAPGLAEAYETGNMPPLLPGIGGTG